MPHFARRLLWATTVGALGCDAPAALVGNACTPGVAFTVAATAPPEFRWTPGVVYGTVPTTAQQFGDLAPLEAGQTYRVALKVTDSEGEPTQVGEATFRVPGE